MNSDTYSIPYSRGQSDTFIPRNREDGRRTPCLPVCKDMRLIFVWLLKIALFSGIPSPITLLLDHLQYLFPFVNITRCIHVSSPSIRANECLISHSIDTSLPKCTAWYYYLVWWITRKKLSGCSRRIEEKETPLLLLPAVRSAFITIVHITPKYYLYINFHKWAILCPFCSKWQQVAWCFWM